METATNQDQERRRTLHLFVTADGEKVYRGENWFWVCVEGVPDIGIKPCQILKVSSYYERNKDCYFGQYKNAELFALQHQNNLKPA